MGQFWTKLVVIVHKIARFRTRKPNNTLSALKSIHRKNNNLGGVNFNPVYCVIIRH